MGEDLEELNSQQTAGALLAEGFFILFLLGSQKKKATSKNAKLGKRKHVPKTGCFLGVFCLISLSLQEGRVVSPFCTVGLLTGKRWRWKLRTFRPRRRTVQRGRFVGRLGLEQFALFQKN